MAREGSLGIGMPSCVPTSRRCALSGTGLSRLESGYARSGATTPVAATARTPALADQEGHNDRAPDESQSGDLLPIHKGIIAVIFPPRQFRGGGSCSQNSGRVDMPRTGWRTAPIRRHWNVRHDGACPSHPSVHNARGLQARGSTGVGRRGFRCRPAGGKFPKLIFWHGVQAAVTVLG